MISQGLKNELTQDSGQSHTQREETKILLLLSKRVATKETVCQFFENERHFGTKNLNWEILQKGDLINLGKVFQRKKARNQ